MKSVKVLLLILAIVCMAVTPSLASESSSYMLLKAGSFDPKGDLEAADSVGSVGISYGINLSESSALEVGMGRHKLSETSSGTDLFLGNWTETDEITILPLRVTYKGGSYSDRGALYAGIGLGLYLASTDMTLNSSTMGYGSVSGTSIALGVHLSLGGHLNINESMFLGLDITMDKTQDATFDGVVYGLPIEIETNLDGQTYSLALGIRF